MPAQITKNTAQQIVDTVKEVCGYDINFIRPDGIIIASTDPGRVGDFHEIGAKAARTGQTLEVSGKEHFPGSRSGVNMPFSWRGETVAVIGITGEPEHVRKYARLARQITHLVLREQELDTADRNREAETGYVIRSLTGGSDIPEAFLCSWLKAHHLPSAALYRTVVIRLSSSYSPASPGETGQKILSYLRLDGSDACTFLYPNRYIQIIPDSVWNKQTPAARDLAASCAGLLSVGVGSCETLRRQNISYGNALLALSSGRGNFTEYDALDIEILTGSLSEKDAQNYMDKTISRLSEKEKEILRAYFARDLSLKETSEALFIHKNTLQYHLDKIHTLTGYNPRRFRDAVILYVGLKMEIQKQECGSQFD